MSLIERFYFTYQDYLRYCDYYDVEYTDEGNLCVAEESEEYYYNSDETSNKNRDKKHDKIFKDILKNKEEMSRFISRFINYEVKTKELEVYNGNYITKSYKYKQADIVYKLKEKEIYFLIEHQTKVDYSMPYRILEYCIEIIRNALEGKEINNKMFKYPRIIPIVLYTGNQKWTVNTSFAESVVEDQRGKCENIDIRYNLIDINIYDDKELLDEGTMLTYAMLMEKSRNNKEIIDYIGKITNNIKNSDKNNKNEMFAKLKRLVLYVYGNLDQDSLEEIIRIIEMNEEVENMSTVQERIAEEFYNNRIQARKEGRIEGIKETIKTMIRNMLENNIEEEKILKCTNAKKEDIEKIKKELKNK